MECPFNNPICLLSPNSLFIWYITKVLNWRRSPFFSFFFLWAEIFGSKCKIHALLSLCQYVESQCRCHVKSLILYSGCVCVASADHLNRSHSTITPLSRPWIILTVGIRARQVELRDRNLTCCSLYLFFWWGELDSLVTSDSLPCTKKQSIPAALSTSSLSEKIILHKPLNFLFTACLLQFVTQLVNHQQSHRRSSLSFCS